MTHIGYNLTLRI